MDNHFATLDIGTFFQSNVKRVWMRQPYGDRAWLLRSCFALDLSVFDDQTSDHVWQVDHCVFFEWLYIIENTNLVQLELIRFTSCRKVKRLDNWVVGLFS